MYLLLFQRFNPGFVKIAIAMLETEMHFPIHIAALELFPAGIKCGGES